MQRIRLMDERDDQGPLEVPEGFTVTPVQAAEPPPADAAARQRTRRCATRRARRRAPSPGAPPPRPAPAPGTPPPAAPAGAPAPPAMRSVTPPPAAAPPKHHRHRRRAEAEGRCRTSELVEILLETGAGGVTVDVIEQALATQGLGKEEGRLGEILVHMRAATEDEVLQALGRQLGVAYLPELRTDEVDVELATKVPIGFAKQHRVLPIRMEGQTALVATADPLDVGALDDLRAQLGAAGAPVDVQPLLHPSGKILDAHQPGLRQASTTAAATWARARRRRDGRRRRGAGRHPRRHRRGPHHPLGELAAVQRGQGARQRHSHRAGRKGGHRPLPHRRRAVRDPARDPRSSCRRSSRA